MKKERSKSLLQAGGTEVRKLAPLLILLLLAVSISGVMAQEDGTGPVVVFEDDGPPASLPEAEEAVTQEVWIPASKDSYLVSNNPQGVYGFRDTLLFGFQQNGLGAMRPIFKFKVEEFVPSDANISYAEVQFYLTGINDSDTSRGYAAHNVSQAWDEGTVSWATMPPYGPEIGRGVLGNSPGWQATAVTSEAEDWLENPDKNKGVILIGDERPGQNYDRTYFSRETSTGLAPRLFVRYDVNTDNVAPIATVIKPSAGSWSPPSFEVEWEGHDPPNGDGSPGSGIRWYDVYYTTDGGRRWNIGRAQVTGTTSNAGPIGHLVQVGLYVRAQDNAGNEGSVPSGSGSIQTWTRVDAEAPDATVNPLPDVSPHTSFTVSWQDTKENNESGIRYYDVQYRQGGGDWQQLVYDTTATSTLFNRGESGNYYEFRARAVDNVGNVQPWGDAQAATVVWTEPLAGILPFDPPIYQKLDGPESGDGFVVQWEGYAPPGNSITAFEVQFQRPGSSTWLAWPAATNTTQTSAFFELQLTDPDGRYTFRARARDSAGTQGDFHEEIYGSIIVDRFAPFFKPQPYLPVIVND